MKLYPALVVQLRALRDAGAVSSAAAVRRHQVNGLTGPTLFAGARRGLIGELYHMQGRSQRYWLTPAGREALSAWDEVHADPPH